MATQYRIERDAENERIVIRRADDTTGDDIDDYPKISIALPDAAAVMSAAADAGEPDLLIQLRVVADCTDGVAGWRLVLCSQFIPGDLP